MLRTANGILLLFVVVGLLGCSSRRANTAQAQAAAVGPAPTSIAYTLDNPGMWTTPAPRGYATPAAPAAPRAVAVPAAPAVGRASAANPGVAPLPAPPPMPAAPASPVGGGWSTPVPTPGPAVTPSDWSTPAPPVVGPTPAAPQR